MDIHEVFKIYKNTGDTALAQLAPADIALQIPEPLAKLAGLKRSSLEPNSLDQITSVWKILTSKVEEHLCHKKKFDASENFLLVAAYAFVAGQLHARSKFPEGDGKRKLSSKSENASPVCFLGSDEVRDEYR